MKILNYLNKLEGEENEKFNKIKRRELELLKQSQKASIEISILSKELKYHFIKLTKELEDIGGGILKLSKKAISDLTNNEGGRAENFLVEAFEKIKSFDNKFLKLKKEFEAQKTDIEQGDIQEIRISKLENDFLNAKEEYLEAKILFFYLKKGIIYKPKEKLLEDFKSYSGALSDFCGELLRKARLDIIEKQYSKKEIKKYYQDIKYIYQVLSNFSFSNKSGVCRKMEQLKDHIKGFEDILFDLRDK